VFAFRHVDTDAFLSQSHHLQESQVFIEAETAHKVKRSTFP
jgi:hypothetical protein